MRLRVTFAKTGSLRYTGHIDLQTVWERTARRAGLPLAYTHGFHPGPKLQIAAALPLGFSGRAEVIDMWLDLESADSSLRTDRAEVGRLQTPEIGHLLQAAAPPGLTIISVEEADERAPALQTQVAAAEYEVTLLEAGSRSELESQAAQVLAAESLPGERRGKPYDLRPLILSLALTPAPLPAPSGGASQGEGEGVRVHMVLSAREGATGRPEAVLAAMGIPVENTRIERIGLIFKNEIE